MTCKPSRALLLALALAGCGGGDSPRTSADWRALLARGDGAGAEAVLRRELEAGAPRGRLAPFLGEAALLQGDLAEAHQWLDRTDFAPDTAAEGFRMLGRAQMREGDLAAAGHAFDHALAISAESPELWVDIGRLRWRGGEQAQAAEAAERALELGPGNPAALLFRGQLARDAHGNAAALRYFERGLAAFPGHPDLLAEQAASLGELGRAMEMLVVVRQMEPGPRSFYLQAVLAARAGQSDLARELLQKSGDLDREVPAAMMLLAVIDLENGNAESAAQGFERLLRRQPDNRRARLLFARALAAGGNYRELVARFGGKADTPYEALLVGRAYEALGERAEASPYLDRAYAATAPRLVGLRTNVSLDVARARDRANGANVVAVVRGLIAAKRAGEARLQARAFLDAHPGSADAMALAGDAALASGDAAEALRHYRAAAAIRRPWSLAKRMAFALDKLGQHREATALIRRQFAGEPSNAEAFAWLRRRSTS